MGVGGLLHVRLAWNHVTNNTTCMVIKLFVLLYVTYPEIGIAPAYK